MKVKFFADSFNDRRVWDWPNGEYVTDDDKEVMEFIRVYGLRHEIVEEEELEEVIEPIKEVIEPIEEPKPVKKAKKSKKKGFIKRLLTNG